MVGCFYTPHVFDILTSMFTVFNNNHTAVWGSWYSPSTGQWGYACCHSIMHASYCAGEAGIQAAESSSARSLLASSSSAPAPSNKERPTKTLVDDHKETERTGKDKETLERIRRRVGEGDVKLDEAKLAEAMEDERKRKTRGLEDEGETNGKKRKYDGGFSKSYDVTEEELGTWTFLYFPLPFLTPLSFRGLQKASGGGYGRPNVQLQGHRSGLNTPTIPILILSVYRYVL